MSVVLLYSCTLVEKTKPEPAPEPKLSWFYDGTVSLLGVAGHKTTLQTKLDNAYYAFESTAGLYIAGFVIDKNSINHPYLVFVNIDLTEQITWPQNAVIEQLFHYKQALYFIDEDGNTRINIERKWQPSQLTLKAHSRVIDSQSDLIACVPTPLSITDNTRGHCYSLKKNWRVNIAWRGIAPMICDQDLIAIEDFSSRMKIHKIDIKTGEILQSSAIKTLPANGELCDITVN